MIFLKPNRLLSGLVLCAALSGCATLPTLVPGKDALSSDEHFKLGVSYESQGDLLHAAEQYQLAVKRDSHNAQALLNPRPAGL